MVIRRVAAACLVGLGLVAVACSPNPSTPSNVSPLAVITPIADTNVAVGEEVTFDAANSGDPDGSIVAWNWDFADFTTGSGVNVVKSFASSGSFEVKLTVTDNKGATASSTVAITVYGPPATPTGLTKVGSGLANFVTFGDFSWNPVPGAEKYEVLMDGQVGCVTDHSGQFDAPATTGRVREIGLCLGSQYDIQIRAYANGLWSPWSPAVRIWL